MSKIQILKSLAGALVATACLLVFQNCGQGFGNATDGQLEALDSLDSELDAEAEGSELVFDENEEFRASAAPSQIISRQPGIDKIWRVSDDGRTMTVRIYKGYYKRIIDGRESGTRVFPKFNIHLNGRYIGTVTGCTRGSRRYCNVKYSLLESNGWRSGMTASFKIAGIDPDGNYTPISNIVSRQIP